MLNLLLKTKVTNSGYIHANVGLFLETFQGKVTLLQVLSLEYTAKNDSVYLFRIKLLLLDDKSRLKLFSPSILFLQPTFSTIKYHLIFLCHI